MTYEETLLVYHAEMKTALMAFMDGDMATFEKWRYRWPNPEIDGMSSEVIQAGVHKAVTGTVDMPMEYRIRAKRWLLDRGMESQDDGDVPVAMAKQSPLRRKFDDDCEGIFL